jgi:multisubunit Na+/H+ antiporter MnhB subunit
LTKSTDQIGIENIVTAILASYRGFDTMLETFVIFITSFCIGFGVLSIRKITTQGEN